MVDRSWLWVVMTLSASAGACGRIDFAVRLDATPHPTGPFGPAVRITPLANLDDPSLTPDLLELYANDLSFEVLVARRASPDDGFPAPVRDALLSSTTNESEVDLSADGLTIHFASARIASTYDIWRAQRPSFDAVWTAPVLVPELSSSGEEGGGAMTTDALTIVFNRVTTTSRDLMIAHRASAADPWDPPTSISELNTADDESAPCLSDDRLTLYFDSNRTGERDLYVARRSSPDEPFGPAEPMVDVNSSAYDSDPWVSRDGRTIVFSSERDGAGAIYQAVR